MILINNLIIFTWFNVLYETIRYNKDTIIDIVYDTEYAKILFYSTIGIYSYNKLILTIFGDTKIGNSIKTLIYYIINFSCLYVYLHSQKWFYDNVIMEGYKTHTFTIYAKILYIISNAYYINELYFHLTRKIKRKDDMEMLVHHVLTITLITFSYYTNALRAGLYILYLHDINDIFLHISKLLVYHKVKDKYSTFTFALFGISWVYTRLYIFPFYIVYDVYLNKECVIVSILFYTVFILIGLNIIWFGYFIKGLVNLLNGKLEDVREED